jgi:hypothetical protein
MQPPPSASLRGQAAQLPKLGIIFDHWRSGRWRAADAQPLGRPTIKWMHHLSDSRYCAQPRKQKSMGLFRNNARGKDINRLIFDIAEFGKRSDVDEIYTRLKHLELYASVVSANFPFDNGAQVKIDAGRQLTIPTAKINGREFIVFLVDKADPRLGQNFVGMNASEAFNMVERIDSLSGIILYNNKQSYFGIERQDFGWIRTKHLEK